MNNILITTQLFIVILKNKKNYNSRKQLCKLQSFGKIKNVLKFDVEIHNMRTRQGGNSQLTSSTIIDKTRNEVLHGLHLQEKKKVLDRCQ